MPNTYLTVPIPVSTGREYFSNPFVRKSYAALCTAYSSKQHSIPAVLLKYLPEENKYTEIPTGVKSTYRFITEQREISESYQNTYRGTQAIPKYLLGGANTGFYVGRYYFSNPCLLPGLFIFVFFKFSGVVPKLRSRKLPNLRVTWHFSLVQRRVKNGQTLTVKGMVKKWQNFISEVTNFSP